MVTNGKVKQKNIISYTAEVTSALQAFRAIHEKKVNTWSHVVISFSFFITGILSQLIIADHFFKELTYFI